MATRSTRAPDAEPRTFPAEEDLRDDQRARRQGIVDAAERLMVSVDYDRIQVRDVAEEAGVALGTLYRYFNSKDHLFACALGSWSRRFGDHLELAATGPTNTRLKAVYRRAARAFERQPRVYGVVMQVQSSTDPHAVGVFHDFARNQTAAFGSVLESSRLAPAKRDDVLAVMNAVLDENLRAWRLGLQDIAAVYRAIDRAADLIVAR